MSRVLIVPMAAMVQTAGSLGRAITLAQALESKGHIVSLCVASDVNHDRAFSMLFVYMILIIILTSKVLFSVFAGNHLLFSKKGYSFSALAFDRKLHVLSSFFP